MSALNLDSYAPRSLTPDQQFAQTQAAKKVKTLGIVSLILAIMSIIPLLGILLLLPAFFLSRYALRVSRQNLVDYDFEKFAFWASRISLTSLILTVLGLIRIFLL